MSIDNNFHAGTEAESQVPATLPTQQSGNPAGRPARQRKPAAKTRKAPGPKDGAVAVDTPWMTCAEAAGYLRINVWTINQLMNRGQLPRRKVANSLRFLKAELDATVK